MTPTRTRRTQAERRATTRAALVSAAVACLLEQGYAGLTIGEVQRRAGMARGTLLHHYPTRADLVAAAVSHLIAERVDAAATAAVDVPPGEGRIDALVDAVWEDLSSPAFHAVLELWVAARHDTDLREALARAQPGVLGTIQVGLESALAEVAPGDPRVPEAVAFTVQLLTGLSLTGLAGARPRDQAATLGAWKRALRTLLAQPVPPHREDPT